MSIVLIVVYFGKFNNYFDLWLKSAGINTSIDFLIVTDNLKPKNCPENVKFINLTFKEVYERLQKLFDFKIVLHPYKLCDFKPVYGDAFYDYIEKYDFWGHCDLDVIFGDIRSFLTPDILNNMEQILQRGHFTLYKNNGKCRKLYLRTAEKDNVAYPYDKAFQTGHSCYFDEYLGMGIVADLYCRVYRDQKIENVLLDVPPEKYELYSYVYKKEYFCKWENGKLYRFFLGEDESKEYMYVHLQKRTMQIEFDNKRLDQVESFYILPDKFSLKSDYSISNAMREKRKKENKKAAVVRIVKKLFTYGLVSGIQHKIQMRKTIKWLNENKPGF